MEQIKVVKHSSREEVALELTKIIAAAEFQSPMDKQTFRKRYLDLYVECFEATSGYRPEK